MKRGAVWLMMTQYQSWFHQAKPEQAFQFALNRQYITGDTRARYEQLRLFLLSGANAPSPLRQYCHV
jgi:hypothetical protein